MERMNSTTSGPFPASAGRRPAVAPRNAFPARNNTADGTSFGALDGGAIRNRYAAHDRPGTSPEFAPSAAGSLPRNLSRQNGYGEFGPDPSEFEPPPFGASNRAETFPRPDRGGAKLEAPTRTPSAPGFRTNRTRRPSDADILRPPTRGSPTQQRQAFGAREGSGAGRAVDLAREFGQGNPFHSPSESASSSLSGSSQSTRSTPPSSRTSPAKWQASKDTTKAAAGGGSRFDDLLSDLQMSMDEADQAKAPPPVPAPAQPTLARRDDRAAPPMGRGGSAFDRARPPPTGLASSPPSTNRGNKRYDPAVQSARGDCKACGQTIFGKSISSADGRLTGRYHKACFVCTQCRAPFSSSTFYVLNDAPYCELHYHELNGSLCTSCGIGIEGQYLEDESAMKHHPGCFRCGDCGKVLQDGYFEVNGLAFCEQDAWARVLQQQQQQQQQQSSLPMDTGRPPPQGQARLGLPTGPGSRMPPAGRGMGLPNGRLGPRPRLEKRMTRIGVM
jgi:hypothetical protein